MGFWVSAIFAIGIIAGKAPERILPTVAKVLAMAGQRMARCHAIKQLTWGETLGEATAPSASTSVSTFCCRIWCVTNCASSSNTWHR